MWTMVWGLGRIGEGSAMIKPFSRNFVHRGLLRRPVPHLDQSLGAGGMELPAAPSIFAGSLTAGKSVHG
jgi:hypothetical protein